MSYGSAGSAPPIVAVTGATGSIGPHLVAALKRRGVVIRLIGRDVAALEALYPDCAGYGWDDLGAACAGSVAVIHLAVRNNDAGGTLADFRETNVALTMRVVEAAIGAASRVVFASTFRAIDPRGRDFYGQSKREAELAIAASEVPWTVVRLPAVQAGDFSGRLSRLNVLPAALRPHGLISALRPEVSAAKAADALAQAAIAGMHDNEVLEVFDDKGSNRWYRSGKRALDIVVAIGIAVTLWWLLLALWIAVRVTSKGPGLFVQRRTGRDGTPFDCFKFRTMMTGTPHSATHLVSRAAVTPLGGFLRRSKLDELPQIANLLNGTMTLVGPRPCLPTQVELIAARRAQRVDTLTPGITGHAQVLGIDMSDPEVLARADACYLARRSLVEDLRILLATVRGRGMADRTAPA